MSFKDFMKYVRTDTVYIAFSDVYGEYVQVDQWGCFDGLNLLKAITKWGDYNVKSATPLDHSLEVVLYA